jgi:hypothetical protein
MTEQVVQILAIASMAVARTSTAGATDVSFAITFETTGQIPGRLSLVKKHSQKS